MERVEVKSKPRRDRTGVKTYRLELDKYQGNGLYYRDLISWLAKKGANPVTVEEFVHGRLRRVGLLYILQTQLKTSDLSTNIESLKASVREGIKHLSSLKGLYRRPSILDVGTEFDEYLVQLRSEFNTQKVIGLNIRETAAGACRYGHHSRKSKDIVLYDGNTIPDMRELSDLDIINVRMVLHHAEDWRSLMTQLYDRLKPGGVLVIVEHDVPSVPIPDQKLCLDIVHDVYDFVINREYDDVTGPLSNINLIPTEELLRKASQLSPSVTHVINASYETTLLSKITVMITKPKAE